MLKVSATLLLLAASLSGCGTTPRNPEIPRPKPVEAMQACAVQLCTLRPEIANLELADQLAMILACKIADAEAYRKCSAKQEALSEWMEAK